MTLARHSLTVYNNQNLTYGTLDLQPSTRTCLEMTTLNIASKANQATTLPALLVANYAKESDSKASINVHFQDVDILKSGNKTSVELVQGNSSPTYGCDNVINELLSTFSLLQAKHADLVCA